MYGYSNLDVNFPTFSVCFIVVRGMMYYWQALLLQYLIENAGDSGKFTISRADFRIQIPRFIGNHSFTKELYNMSNVGISEGPRSFDYNERDKRLEQAKALADLKFTYVVSCQLYGSQKKSKNTFDRSCYNNILNLMVT